MKDKILKLLGEGIIPTSVAAACGVTLSYISQLLAEPEFAEAVAQLKLVQLQAATLRDRNYDALEDRLLGMLTDVLPFMTKPREIIGALDRVNNLKRRGATIGSQEIDVSGSRLVNLQLPSVTINQFMLNGKNEVIEVAGRALATMSAKTLMQQVSGRNQQDAITIDIQPIVQKQGRELTSDDF